MNSPAALAAPAAPADGDLRDGDDLEAEEAACGQTTEPDDTCTGQGCDGCRVDQPPSLVALALALTIGALLRPRPRR